MPILISVGKAPEFSAPERISLRRIFQISPLAVIGLTLNGMSIAMVFGMGAVYGKSIGMSSSEIGYFMTAPVIGAMLLQYPVGRLSDRFDRRVVILGVSAMAAATLLLAWQLELGQFALLLVCMVVFGGFLFPMYSLCIAHANDFLTPSQMIAVASGLVMMSGAGAYRSPAALLEYLKRRQFLPLLASTQIATAIIVTTMTSGAQFQQQRRALVAIPEASCRGRQLEPEAEWVMSDEEAGDAEILSRTTLTSISAHLLDGHCPLVQSGNASNYCVLNVHQGHLSHHPKGCCQPMTISYIGDRPGYQLN